MHDKTRSPTDGDSGEGVPAGTAREGDASRPDIGDIKAGRRIRQRSDAPAPKQDDLAPEARGGAGGSRNWPGDS